jgi:hypothetical protein
MSIGIIKLGQYNDIAAYEFHLLPDDDPGWIESQVKCREKIAATQDAERAALLYEALGL